MIPFLVRLLLLVSLPLTAGPLLSPVDADLFHTDKVPQDQIFYRSELLSAEQLRQATKAEYNIAPGRYLLLRARFIIPQRFLAEDAEFFAQAQTFTLLNRKTRFTKQARAAFSAVRPAWFGDIRFQMHARVETAESRADGFAYFAKNSGISREPELLVMQHMGDYNRYFTSGESHFALYTLSQQQQLVELIAISVLSDGVPGWIARRIEAETGNKLLHFRTALIELGAI